LIHYWNFNNLPALLKRPVPPILADFTAGHAPADSVYLEYYVLPGTSSGWATGNNGGGQIDQTGGTDSNARNGDVAGNGMRCRNPLDSAELRWHIPSTGFSNLVITFALQSSSTTSGDSAQIYSYSTDGGLTWKYTGITVNGANTDTLDVEQGGATGPYESGTLFGLVHITLTDPTVNNNAKLIFRITFLGNTHLLSGNNRFDNFTVDGVGAAGPPPASITMRTPVAGSIFVPGQKTTISFTTFSKVGQVRTIQFSPDSGKTWVPVTQLTSDSSYTLTAPNVATTKGFISVTDSAGVTAKTGPFIIYPIPSNNLLVDYWAFNNLNTVYYSPNIPNLPADFSANQSHPGYLQYVNFAKTPNYSYVDNVAGDTLNARIGAWPGEGFRARNPTDSMELHFVIPTTGFKGISITYALQTSDSTLLGDAPHTEKFSYSTDGGTTWITTGMTVNGTAGSSLNVLQPQYGSSASGVGAFGRVSIRFGSQADNNPNFVFRIQFADSTHATSGNNRFDNITIDASATDGVNPPAAQSLVCYAFPSPSQDHISILCPEQGRKSISITDIVGHAIANFSESQEQYNYDVRDLASGTYFIHIQTDNGEQATLRFVKE
ncbi:MAG: T9SS type A sorting domain-containing protein, partial [Candidatus Kapaibacterium sp.]